MLLSSRRLILLLLLLLVSSLGANAYLYFSPRSPEPVAAKQTPPSLEADEPADPGCSAELEACRRAATGMPLGAWGSALTQALSAQANAPASPPPHAAADPRGSLCRIARDSMKAQWLEKRDFITAVLTHDLSDTAKQRADAERDADRAADTLSLQGSGRRGFESDFVDLRSRHMADLSAASQTNPVDWSRLLSGAHSLFDGEDALVQQQLGADAVEKYKDSESDRRMTILSILATYADADWDNAVLP